MSTFDMTPEQWAISEIFFPSQLRQVQLISSENRKFSHYTTAESALNILQSRQVWMRNAAIMNDFSEIEYGLALLNGAYGSEDGAALKALLDSVHTGFCDELNTLFNGWLSHFRTETYVISLSEHLPHENETGRLSMWRAYGGSTGVALVLNATPFLTSNNNLKAYSSLVEYLDEDGFRLRFREILDQMIEKCSIWTSLDRKFLMSYIFTVFRFAVICTKHPGFHEEREWRVVYAPTLEPSATIMRSLGSIKGVPQAFYKLPLRHSPDDGLIGADIPSLLERLIVGPSQYPLTTAKAFVAVLADLGVENASDRVCVSNIPLRQ